MKAIAERLNSKTYVQDGHLLWGGSSERTGYGRVRFGAKIMRAHRLSWELAYGPIPEGVDVLHTCDIPPCILPWHLYLGTQVDNMQDMLAAGNHNSARKTHCPKCDGDYELNSQGKRFCRPCRYARLNKQKRDRYAADPEFRERTLAAASLWRASR